MGMPPIDDEELALSRTRGRRVLLHQMLKAVHSRQHLSDRRGESSAPLVGLDPVARESSVFDVLSLLGVMIEPRSKRGPSNKSIWGPKPTFGMAWPKHSS